MHIIPNLLPLDDQGESGFSYLMKLAKVVYEGQDWCGCMQHPEHCPSIERDPTKVHKYFLLLLCNTIISANIEIYLYVQLYAYIV